ncbi:hypothetical protein D3C76_388430 [compost metagenome]
MYAKEMHEFYKEVDLKIEKSKIYRNLDILDDREEEVVVGRDENGLSFFTYIMAKNNKAVMTTVEAVKKEGVFLIEKDPNNPKHYLISAKDPYEYQLWMNSKSNANMIHTI